MTEFNLSKKKMTNINHFWTIVDLIRFEVICWGYHKMDSIMDELMLCYREQYLQ